MNKKFRFGGIDRLYGKKSTLILKKSKVIIIGIGGVGSWAAESLARSGVGNIKLIDLDDICITNINRQIHATDETIGKSKVHTMKQRLSSINPEIKAEATEAFINQDNMHKLIDDQVNIVIDCIDEVAAKAALINYSKINKIKMITVGGAGGKKDPTKVKIADLSKTTHDPLAAKLRKTLRKEYNFPIEVKKKFHVDCVFSEENVSFPLDLNRKGTGTMDCSNGFGSIANVTATFGFAAAAKAIDQLLS